MIVCSFCLGGAAAGANATRPPLSRARRAGFQHRYRAHVGGLHEGDHQGKDVPHAILQRKGERGHR